MSSFNIGSLAPKQRAINIWNPRYSTNDILVAERKIFHWPNYVRITKDPAYSWKLLMIKWEDTTKYKRQQNWQIKVVCIPISAFEVVADE